jgi:hypothetical protein
MERKNRAERRNRGDRPCGPDWETAHTDARPLTLTVSFLVLRASTTCPGSLTLAGWAGNRFVAGRASLRLTPGGTRSDLGDVTPVIELTKELIGAHLD